tara:strand:- start:253 stop:798 length:546 start_codon:yes stop_codon:yes gene_type:complete
MAATLKQVEAAPASYPDVPSGLSASAAALDADAIWQRIESWIAHRWNEREVVWTVEVENGADEWIIPLAPVSTGYVEQWRGGAWDEVLFVHGPMGLLLPSDGTFRITANVGSDKSPPAAVMEAYRRLAEYLADKPDRSAASSYSVNMGGAIEESYNRNPAWVARALEYSGAADLLRPYRRP